MLAQTGLSLGTQVPQPVPPGLVVRFQFHDLAASIHVQLAQGHVDAVDNRGQLGGGPAAQIVGSGVVVVLVLR
jgi:hypothetical protein